MLASGGKLDGVRYLSPLTIALMACNYLNGDTASNAQIHSMREELSGLKMQSPPSLNQAGLGFGLGVAVVVDPTHIGTTTVRGEFSWMGGASTYFFVDPVHNISAVMALQMFPGGFFDDNW